MLGMAIVRTSLCCIVVPELRYCTKKVDIDIWVHCYCTRNADKEISISITLCSTTSTFSSFHRKVTLEHRTLFFPLQHVRQLQYQTARDSSSDSNQRPSSSRTRFAMQYLPRTLPHPRERGVSDSLACKSESSPCMF